MSGSNGARHRPRSRAVSARRRVHRELARRSIGRGRGSARGTRACRWRTADDSQRPPLRARRRRRPRRRAKTELDERGGEERHVAGQNQQRSVARRRQRRVHAAERASAGRRDRRHRGTGMPARAADADDQRCHRSAAQRRELAIEEPAPSTISALLSLPAETPRPAAGEDGRTPHVSSAPRSIQSIRKMREAGIGRVLVAASIRASPTFCRPARVLRELAERRRAARGHDRAGAALRRAQLPAPGGRRLRQLITTRAGEYAADWTVEDAAGYGGDDQRRSPRFAAPHARHARGARLVQQQLQRQPRDGAHAARLGEVEHPSSIFCTRARPRAAPALRASTRPRSTRCWPAANDRAQPRRGRIVVPGRGRRAATSRCRGSAHRVGATAGSRGAERAFR